MIFTPIYIAMTFIKTWRIRSFRARLLEFLSGNTSVAFCKVPENAAETPTLSSKLCTNPKNAYLCDLIDYTNTSRICSMKPTQHIDINDWVSCAGGLPLGNEFLLPDDDLNVEVLFECEMDPHEDSSYQNIISLESMGHPIAWKAGSHLAIVMKTNIEHLSLVGFHFVGGEFIIDYKLPVVRIQTVQISGEPNKATDLSMRGLRSEIQQGLKFSCEEFQWPIHSALLRKLSKVVDIKSERRSVEMNGGGDKVIDTTPRTKVTLHDVSTITTKSLGEEEVPGSIEPPIEIKKEKSEILVEKITKEIIHKSPERKIRKSPEKIFGKSPEKKLVIPENGELVVENVTVEIQHNITPKKSSLKLDLKKGTSQASSSLLNISSQIKSITTHKRVVSTTAPKRPQSRNETTTQYIKEESPKSSPSQMTPKSAKSSRPLVNTKSPNVLIYSDSVVARDNLEMSLKRVLDCDRYTVYSVSPAALCGGAWRGRAALVAVAGCAGRAAPLLLAHLLDGGRLLALCSDLLHTVLPHYKTAEIRENEVVQFSYDKWESVKMKHHIFCYQASPAKKQFSTESDRQPSKYTGHPGHELDIQVLASEETWRTPSLLQATDTTNKGVAIFSQIHLEADPCDYLGEEGVRSNEARIEILHKILGDILGLHVKDTKDLTKIEYTRGYFLGNHLQKLSLVEGWCGGVKGEVGRVQQLGGVRVQWCARGEGGEPPSETFLPVALYECPEHFDTVEYFDNLTSTELGRLLIYADVLTSTHFICGSALAHGVGATARRQLRGRGRAGNTWIGPPGQAAISLQVWQKVSPLLPLVQHAAALAAVRAVTRLPGYHGLDIRIKWPNDIYYGREVKIGGTITSANCTGDDVIIDIGTGVNISNKVPTTCLDEIITEYNQKHGTSLEHISIEKFLARYCSELELVLDDMQYKGVEYFLEEYYKYWLHTRWKIISGDPSVMVCRVYSGEEVRVCVGEGSPVCGRVSRVDGAGWLCVEAGGGELRVAPDGNTFDMMTGLLAPKC